MSLGLPGLIRPNPIANTEYFLNDFSSRPDQALTVVFQFCLFSSTIFFASMLRRSPLVNVNIILMIYRYNMKRIKDGALTETAVNNSQKTKGTSLVD